MLLADSNFWVALGLSRHQFHTAAMSWLHRREAENRLVLCRATQQSFLRLITTPGLTAQYGLPAVNNREAWSVYQSFFDSGRVEFTEEPADLEMHWQQLSSRPTASPKLWMDAYLAAFAMKGGYRLLTSDTGFRQFRGLEVVLLGN
jgi:uncharacterized protein